MKKYITLLLLPLFMTGCETGRASLSQPPSSSETEAYREIESPIAISGIHADRNSADGLDVMVTWKNISDKDLKYVYLEIGLKNRVGDWVLGEISRRSSVTLKYTGPFKPGKTHWGGLSGHPAAIYNREATNIVIKTVKVEFMDGTETATINTASLPSTIGAIASKIY